MAVAKFKNDHFGGDEKEFALFAKGLKSDEDLISQLRDLGITKGLVVTAIRGAVKEAGGLQGTFSQFLSLFFSMACFLKSPNIREEQRLLPILFTLITLASSTLGGNEKIEKLLAILTQKVAEKE